MNLRRCLQFLKAVTSPRSTDVSQPGKKRSRSHSGNSTLSLVAEELDFRICLSNTFIGPGIGVDLSPSQLMTVENGVPGSKITVFTVLKGANEVIRQGYRVELRLSEDSVFDENDMLLAATVLRRRKTVHDKTWKAKITLPKDLAGKTYSIGVVVDPRDRIAETDESNNHTSHSINFMRAELSGQVEFGKSIHTISVRTLAPDILIRPDGPLWIVIHGRNQSPLATTIDDLARNLQSNQPDSQVLVLDWSQAADSGTIGGDGENFIKPVAERVAQLLTVYGISSSQLNLVGYSWGSYIASELSEVMGTVNTLISIDAARDFPGGSYNPESTGEVNFSSAADRSWAFFSGQGPLIFGSFLTTSTAHESYLLSKSDHFQIVPMVANLILSDYTDLIGSHFLLTRLLTGSDDPLWLKRKFDAAGQPSENGIFDTQLTGNSESLRVESLTFFDGLDYRTISS